MFLETIHVAITGPSGSGKTWLAHAIVSALGPRAAYVSLDDFYRDLSPLTAEERSATNFDDPAAIDWECVRSVMDALSAGKTTPVVSYDFATHTRKPHCRGVGPRDFMIWEGLWLLHEPWLRERFGFSAFVDCATEERLARRIARDVNERGRTRASVLRQFREQVEPLGELYVLPQRQWATCQISSPVNNAALKKLLSQILALAGEPRPAQGIG